MVGWTGFWHRFGPCGLLTWLLILEYLAHLFGGKVRPSGKMNCINGTKLRLNTGRKYGGVVEGNVVVSCSSGCGGE